MIIKSYKGTSEHVYIKGCYTYTELVDNHIENI